MSNFVVSARKYRPNRFEDVVGQEHVSRTLKNALQNDHLAHAFLFCGPRGVGKTTCARILAKVINCENITADHEPCNACSSCQSFNDNASFNIVELDAASNNSVEHIRALIEQVRFQPQQGQYKIYIVDEVHMLSTQAFNAFLKTLEEPPAHAIFILATTEKHKIIPTILSRCQIFDFKRIQVANMVAHLENICTQESIEADKSALHIIAQKADGALRDSLSIFDRIVSFSGKKITYEDVIANLNVLDYDYYFNFTEALATEDLSTVMNTFDGVLRKGFDGDILINGLAEHFRNLLVCKDQQTIQLLEVSDDLKKRYSEQAAMIPASFLLTALSLANDCDINYKMARNKRLHVEMALIKMTYIARALKPGSYGAAPNTTPQSAEKKTPNESVVNANSTANAPKVIKSPAPTPVTAPSAPTPKDEKPVAKATPPIAEIAEEPLPKAINNNPGAFKKSSLHGLTKISLADLEKELEDEDVNEEVANLPELSLEKVQAIWDDYAKNVDSGSVKNVLENTEIRLDGETLVNIVGNKLAYSTVQQEIALIDRLRTAFKRPALIRTIEIDPSKSMVHNEPVKAKPLTPKEQYIKMHQINPLVRKLYDTLDLTPDER